MDLLRGRGHVGRGRLAGTNNLGELTAILRLLPGHSPAGEELHPRHSQYATSVVSNGDSAGKSAAGQSRQKPIKNLELIQEIDRAMEGRRVSSDRSKAAGKHHMNSAPMTPSRENCAGPTGGRTPEPGPGVLGAVPESRGSRRCGSGAPGVLPLHPSPPSRTTLWSPASTPP